MSILGNRPAKGSVSKRPQQPHCGINTARTTVFHLAQNQAQPVFWVQNGTTATPPRVVGGSPAPPFRNAECLVRTCQSFLTKISSSPPTMTPGARKAVFHPLGARSVEDGRLHDQPPGAGTPDPWSHTSCLFPHVPPHNFGLPFSFQLLPRSQSLEERGAGGFLIPNSSLWGIRENPGREKAESPGSASGTRVLPTAAG